MSIARNTYCTVKCGRIGDDRLLDKLKKLPVYMREFGMTRGSLLWRAVERKQRQGRARLLQLDVPGVAQKVHVRDTIADCSTFWQCLVQRQYDTSRFPQHASLMARYERTLAEGKVPLIIDGGGNIGLASIWFASTFPRAQIVTIEPDDRNLELLRMNVAAFGERVKVVKGGLWDRHGTLHITNPDSGSAAFRVDHSEVDEDGGIPAFTIDDLCAMAGAEDPLVVKLDIEGAQAQLFASNTDWVARTALVTLELDDWLFPGRGTSQSFFSCISRYPYEYLLGGESIFCFRQEIG